MLQEIVELYPDEEILKCDGYDDCILGYEYNWDGNIRLIYSIKKILDKMVNEEGLSDDEAIEHFEFNFRSGYHGEKTPIWCQDDL